jgi:DNA-binding winged helix-turn-helix (wHTH) protein
MKVADLLYNLDTLYVSTARPLKLNHIGLKLLAVLMQKSPAVVRREALETLWVTAPTDSLRSHVHQLRQVLEPFPRRCCIPCTASAI